MSKKLLQFNIYVGKVLSALMNGLLDRNSVVRKHNAVAIGHIVGSAKESSLEKLFKTLNTWYMERGVHYIIIRFKNYKTYRIHRKER